jgi:hypothetical protein
MPLFRAKVAVVREIPVNARSLDEARRYLDESDEWKQGEGDLQVLDVEQVVHPHGLSDWADPGFLCWGMTEYIDAVEAFYDFWSLDTCGLTEEQANDCMEHERVVLEYLRDEFRRMANLEGRWSHLPPIMAWVAEKTDKSEKPT